MINPNSDVSMQNYNVKQSVIEKRPGVGTLSMDKAYNFDQLFKKERDTLPPELESHDNL